MELDGLFARAVQHEVDHLDGVLFTDRLSPTALADVRSELVDFENQFASQREHGEIPDDGTILARLAELEKLRT
jgi:peptide deformylase